MEEMEALIAAVRKSMQEAIDNFNRAACRAEEGDAAFDFDADPCCAMGEFEQHVNEFEAAVRKGIAAGEIVL